MQKLIRILCVAGVAFCLFSQTIKSAQAAAPTTLGKFGSWSAYSVGDGAHAVCYMSITAKAPAPRIPSRKIKRSHVVLMITHRPAENTTDVVSYTVGTAFKPSSDAQIVVGAKNFNLFTKDDTAWSRDSATDHALALAIRTSESLTITGVAANGTRMADTVALDGADAAYVAIGKACGVAVEPLKKAAPKEKKEIHKPQPPQKPSAPHKSRR